IVELADRLAQAVTALYLFVLVVNTSVATHFFRLTTIPAAPFTIDVITIIKYGVIPLNTGFEVYGIDGGLCHYAEYSVIIMEDAKTPPSSLLPLLPLNVTVDADIGPARNLKVLVAVVPASIICENFKFTISLLLTGLA